MISTNETIGKILFTEEQIRERAREIGKEISNDFRGEEVVLLATLKGSVMWLTDIMKEIYLDTEIDFIQASSYGSNTHSSGVVKVTKDVSMNLYNKNIIIVEDIVDTGITLKYVREYLNERNPKCIKICSMLDKPSRRIADVHADYIGFTVEDLFVIGYGLDFNQKYRNLPYVSYLESHAD